MPFCTQVGHTGPLRPSETGRPIPYIDQVAIDFPELTIVAGHIGYPWTEEMVAVARKHEHVFIDTSAYTVRRYPPELVRYLRSSGGRHKVLFGTNYPMILPEQALGGARRARPRRRDARAVPGGQRAARLRPGRRRRMTALLCYDGSEPARRAIERAGAVLGGGPALVVTVWESVGSVVLRRHPRTALGRELRDISADVVDDLDAGTAASAEATAAEGAELAAGAGFKAEALAHRAIARAGEREEVTVWQALLDVADERDVRVVVLGRRGQSGVRSLLMGSVSTGVLHHTERPVLVVA